MKNNISQFLKNHKKKILIISLIIISVLVIGYLISFIHAQNLIGDDYAFLTSVYKEDDNIFRLIGKIIITKGTPHIRFVFIPHLLFILFFRFTNGEPAAVNAFFLVILGMLAGIGAMSVLVIKKALDLKKIKLNLTQQVAYFTVFIALILNFHIWVLLDFKIASYQVLGTLAMLIYFYFLLKLELKTKKSILALLIAFIFAVHSTDLNILLIAPTFIFVISKNIDKLKKILSLVLIALYPILYYVISTVINARKNVLFQETNPSAVIDHIINVVLKQFIAINFPLILLISALVLAGIIFAIRKGVKDKSLMKLIRENILLTITLFSFIYSFFILIIAAYAYGGSISPHHYAYSYLMLVVTLVLAIGNLINNQTIKKTLRAILSILIAICVAAIFIQNFNNFNAYIPLRENEISLLDSAKNYVLANSDKYPHNNYLIFTSWPDISFRAYNSYYPYSSTEIYDISWAMDGYAILNLNKPTGKTFQLFSPIYLNPDIKSQVGDLIYIADADVTIITANYNKEKNKLEFVEESCKTNCIDRAYQILEPFRPDYLR